MRPITLRQLASAGLTAVLLLLLSACSQSRSTVYARFVDIDRSGWEEAVYCDFNTADVDSALFASTTARYDVVIAVRYTERYHFADLYLQLSPTPEITAIPREVRLTLASPDGTLTGRGSHGLFIVTDTLAGNIALPPLFSLKVSQDMHRPVITGIDNVGLIITKH